jgi:hypothetical protein
MPALKLDRFLSADGSFQPVIEKAREIDALSKLCSAFWPPELARLARVANIKDGTLVILAANGPAAAKLKLLGESLGQFLSKQGAKVNSVSVRVQPEAGQPPDAASQNPPSLSSGGLHELRELYERLEDSPFRNALKKLLEHDQSRRSPTVARKTSGPE